MSKGPGHVEQAIARAFKEHPDKALIVEVLASYIYDPPIEKKHRVAILRAATRVCARMGWTVVHAKRRGNEAVFYNPDNIHSYANSFRWAFRTVPREVQQQLTATAGNSGCSGRHVRGIYRN